MKLPFSPMHSAFLLICSFFFQAPSHSSSIVLSEKEFQKPASDLIYQGKVIDADRALELKKAKFDLSILDPSPNDTWAGGEDTLPLPESDFPLEEEVVKFRDFLPSTIGYVSAGSASRDSIRIFRSSLQSKEGKIFTMYASLQSHSALLTYALMKKVGYQLQKPKHYKKIKIQFSTLQEIKDFKEKLQNTTITEEARWFVEEDEKNKTLTVQDIIIDHAQKIVPTYYWGILPEGYPFLGRRALRAMIVPYVFSMVTESVNLFSWDLGSIFNESVLLNHPYASRFSETTYEDAKWMVRKIAKLTSRDFIEIVQTGAYPKDISALLVEKMISRRNQLVRLFSLQKEFKEIPFNQNLTTGAIKNGKATQEKYEGYAIRFTLGDPESPLRKDEIFGYFRSEFNSTLLSYLRDELNNVIPSYGVQDIARKEADRALQDFFKFARENPGVPYTAPLRTFIGPTAQVRIQGSRNVISGTYYGNDSKIQLVDSIGLSGSIGFFAGLSGARSLIPSASGNLGYQRVFTHVKPLGSIETALKTSVEHIQVQNYMKNLVSALSLDQDGKIDPVKVKEFLENFNENEVFIITDALVQSGSLSVRAPLQQAFGLSPTGPSLDLGLTLSRDSIATKRTYMIRKGDKLQIYLSNLKSRAFHTTFDLNFWINFLKVQSTQKKGSGETEFFELDLSESEIEKNKKTWMALRGLFYDHSSEILRSEKSPYVLHHDSNSKIQREKFLWKREASMEENHQVKIRPPKSEDSPYDPKIKDHPWERTFIASTRVHRSGNNFYSLITDVIKKFTNDIGPDSTLENDNPSNSFMGNSSWDETRTEAEVTPGVQSEAVTVHTTNWAGWVLSKKQLFQLLDRLEERVSEITHGRKIIQKEVFHEMNHLLLYQVKAMIIFYPSAYEKLRKDLRLGNWMSRDHIRDTLKDWYGWFKFDHEARRYSEMGWSDYGTYTPEWMGTILKINRSNSKNPRDLLQDQNRLFDVLVRSIPLNKILSRLSYKDYFMQVMVSGFRTKDENGDSEYLSSSVGEINLDLKRGAYNQFISDYQILEYEMKGKSFSEGF